MVKSNRWSFNIPMTVYLIFYNFHYCCLSCFGPSETLCITCLDEESTNTKNENTLCVNKKSILLLESLQYFQDIPIFESEDFNFFACGLGQFERQFGQVIYCADCLCNKDPDFINRRKLLYIDQDYVQLISSSTSTYQKQARKPIENEYLILNFNSKDRAQLRKKYKLNTKHIIQLLAENAQITTVIANTVNNECLQFGANCNICQPGIPKDGDFLQMQCFKNIDIKEFFIDADHINCKPKTMPHYIQQYQEFYHHSVIKND
ncbi:unnamed protein product [Paramecium pentaurelia]|uniref:Uncharacterized protein n=1 Tax=Paramecium pentaurelia TaxID=43138 RepID=A0A8S1YHZ7_9CILI|nr:unnamed protein product [Paramecium pentaurelia]